MKTTKKNRTAAQQLLEYNEGHQDHGGCGYVNYVVWARVPGEPLGYGTFYDHDCNWRYRVRKQSRKACM
jgi:hypothetical protein